MPQIKIYYRDVSALERYGMNAARAANLSAYNTGVQFLRGKLYAGAAGSIPEQLTNDELLSLDGRKSPYTGSAGDVAHNVLVLDNGDLQVALYDALIKVAQVNTIIKTPLTGRKGSAKEYIQAQDYEISVKGNVLGNMRYGFPIDESAFLHRVLSTPDNFDVANILLNKVFEVNKVVCKSFDMDQNSAKYLNAIPYSIKLLSDEDYDLEID